MPSDRLEMFYLVSNIEFDTTENTVALKAFEMRV